MAYDFNDIRSPFLRRFFEKVFDTTDGHDHDGTNSKSLSPSAVVADDSITTVKIKDANVTAAKLATGSVTSAKILAGAVDTDELAADAVTGAKIADEAIDSEHYVDGSIDTAHIAADAIDGTLIADNAIDSEHYTDGSIDLAHLSADCVDGTKIADDAIDSEHYANGSIDEAHLANDAVTNTKLANISRGYIKVGGASDAPTDLNAKTDGYILVGDGTDIASVAVSGDVTLANTGAVTIGAGVVENSMMAANSVDSDQYVDGSIDLAHMSAESVDSDQYVDGSIDTVHLAATTSPTARTIADPGHGEAIPVTGNGNVALAIADAVETNTLAVPTFAGQIITISADSVAGSGSREVTVASAINAAAEDTATFDAAGEFLSLYGIKVGATFAWRVLASDGVTLS
jgi:hypothetical protein